MKNNTALILIVISIGLFFTFTQGQYKIAKKLFTEASEYQKILENISEIEETRDRLLLAYNNLSKLEIERLNKILPEENDVVRSALDLDGIGSRFDISIGNVRTGTNSRGSNFNVETDETIPYDEATLSFSFASDYENFMRFLSELERNLRLMDIESVTFRVDDEAGIYEHQMIMDTYWLR